LRGSRGAVHVHDFELFGMRVVQRSRAVAEVRERPNHQQQGVALLQANTPHHSTSHSTAHNTLGDGETALRSFNNI
jgi:hypothetical protein